MEVRSRVAADTAAVVPFHCIICFEEFNLKDRPPMVLPCGHTFVCQPCSKRLKRCMECREPLFYTIPKKSNSPKLGPQAESFAGSSRYRHQQQQTPLTPPHPSSPPHPSTITQVPFPIPKNLVLISMMEAASSARQNPTPQEGQQQQEEDAPFTDDSLNQNDGDEFDLRQILNGVATLSGSCGTFVVKAPEGLSILPSIPNIQDLVLDDSVTGATLSISQNKESSFEVLEPLRLEQGQRVQVVQFEDGYAKLARGMGFIKARPDQLVKVGAPLERSCQLEGQLETLTAQIDNLENELTSSRERQYLLQEETRRLKTLPPNHPVISSVVPVAADESSKENKGTEPLLQTPTDVTSLHEIPSMRDAALSSPDDRLVFPITADGLNFPTSNLPTYRRSNSNDVMHDMGFGCDAFLGESAQQLFGMELVNSNYRTNGPVLQSSSHESERRRYSADDNQYVPTLTSSFDTVDFRTGMSCHRGLQTNARHSPTPRGRGLSHRYMMSEHRGIAGRSSSRTVSSLLQAGVNVTP